MNVKLGASIVGGAILVLASCKGAREPRVGQTVTTGARMIMNDDAAMILTNARCQHESACDNIGAAGRFVDADACRRTIFTENAATGVSVTGITATGAGGANVLVSSDLPNRAATVSVAAGQTTTVTYTNAATTGGATGTLVICKIAGTGIAANASFSFTAGGQAATALAGTVTTPGCSSALTLPVGAVTVTETAVTGTSVSAITGTPATPTNINLAARSATVQIAAGQETRITYTNVAP